MNVACVVDNDDIVNASCGVGAAKVVTPRSLSPTKVIHSITPEHSTKSGHDSNTSNDGEVNNRDPAVVDTDYDTDEAHRLELEEARRDAQQSAQALENLVTGIRMVKRILEKESSSDDEEDNTCSSSEEERAQQLTELSLISEKLHGILGSDLLGLLNAAEMVRCHAKLAAKEASALVQDVAEARQEALEAQQSLGRVKKMSRTLYKENVVLKDENKQLRAQRKVLVREVKTLRNEAEVTKQYDTWRLLEHHVLDSIKIHERVMKTPTSPKFSEFNTASESARILSSKSSSSSTSFKEVSHEEVREASPSPNAEQEPEEATPKQDEAATPTTELPSSPTVSSNEEESREQEINTTSTQKEKTTRMKKKKKETIKSPARGNVTLGEFADGFMKNFFGNTPTNKTKSSKVEQSSEDDTPETDKLTEDSSNKVYDDRQDSDQQAPSKEVEEGASTSKVSASDAVPGLEEVSRFSTDDECSSHCQSRDSSTLASSSPASRSRFFRRRAKQTVVEEDSSSSQHKFLAAGCEFSVQIPSTDDKESSFVSGYASPLISPDGSPSGVVVNQQPKPICDEKILRSLAIPSDVDRREARHVLYPRTEIVEDESTGLYEC